MDWLKNYNAQIDCKENQVALKSPEGRTIIFKGQKQSKKFLTILQAKKLLRQGCKAYLAHVMENQKEVRNLEEVLVVNEFPDVFPDELPGIPPDQRN